MPDQIAWPHTSDLLAVNLVTHGDYQFALWYTLTAELRIGRIQRGVQRWGIDHDEYEFAGAPRTALSLPGDDDDHNFVAIAVDGRGHIHVWANMHSGPMQCVTTTTPHTDDDWLATAGWTDASSDFPSVDIRCTYPIPVHFPDGSLLFYIRTGPALAGAGRCNGSIYTRTPSGTTWSAANVLFQGLEVPGAGGAGPWPSATPGSDETADDFSNWSPSVLFIVESPRHPHPGRLHCAWIWHRLESDSPGYTPGVPGPGESAPADITRCNDYPSYGHSDDMGATWKSIDGTTLTVPFHPLNNLAARTGLQDTDDGYAEWCGFSLDDDGLPHLLVSHGAKWWMRYEDGQWTQSTLPGIIDGYIHTGGASSYWWRGKLMMLNTGALSGTSNRRVHMWDLTGTAPVVPMSGYVSTTGFWTPTADPEAYRQFGTIETLAPDGDIPQVFTFGNHARITAA